LRQPPTSNPGGVAPRLARHAGRQPVQSHEPGPADRKSADHWLDLGADLISFGRAFLANPDLVERLRADLPLDGADEATYYQGGDDGYLGYAAYRR
jgi:2,4-dienoyl-CoA reductase-like NADH-dependent reductase (Old Yellow Enzyme family)